MLYRAGGLAATMHVWFTLVHPSLPHLWFILLQPLPTCRPAVFLQLDFNLPERFDMFYIRCEEPDNHGSLLFAPSACASGV